MDTDGRTNAASGSHIGAANPTRAAEPREGEAAVMTEKKKADYYKATHAFGVMYEGAQITVPADEIVPGDSPLLKSLGKAAVEEHFAPVTSFGVWDPAPVVKTHAPAKPKPKPEPQPEAKPEPTPEPVRGPSFGRVESATAAPGEKRP